MTFGKKLKEARKEVKLTQEQLGDLLFVSRSAIAKWETDKGLPDIRNLKSISQILDVSVDYLLDDQEKLNFTVTKRAINLADYTKQKITVWNRTETKTKAVQGEFPDAEIILLSATEKLSKAETFVEGALMILAGIPGVMGITKSFNNIDHSFYLVKTPNKHYLLRVTEDFIESRRLKENITSRKFELGDFTFRQYKSSVVSNGSH